MEKYNIYGIILGKEVKRNEKINRSRNKYFRI